MKRGIDCRGRQTTEGKGMAIIRCPKGHNYDSTLYRKCPICETEAAYNHKSTDHVPEDAGAGGKEPHPKGYSGLFGYGPRSGL